MYQQIVNFWTSLFSVFVGSTYNLFSVSLTNSYAGESVTNSFALNFNRLHTCRVLAFLTLVGLCIFLFYQMYKLIHAFIGGAYE